MRFMVTGGAGFIGSFVVKNLVASSNQVVVVDALTYAGDKARLAPIEDEICFYEADICNYQLIREIIFKHRPDCCINLAAHTHVDRSLQNEAPFIQANISGVQVLLSLLREGMFPSLLQVSTDEVYGEGGPHSLFTESSPFNPSSPYAASKAAAELLLQSYRRSFGVDVRVIRMCNIYGPYQHPEKLIPLVISRFLNDRPITVYGSGEQRREWMYVEDAARCIIALALRGRSGDIYNAGSGEEIVNRELVYDLARRMGKDMSLVQYGADRPGHDFRYGVDSSKIQKELNFYPAYNFARGIEETIAWYQKNQIWTSSKLER